MLRSLYNWTMALSARKSAAVWLAVIAFVESSVFLVPADVLFLPMALARPQRAWRYALIATVFSVLGGIAGWGIGYFAFDALAEPILRFWGKLDTFNELKAGITYETVVLLLVTSGFAHLPPIKVVTILSGVAHVNLGLFVISAIVTRGASCPAWRMSISACSSYRRSSPAGRGSSCSPGCCADMARTSAISSKSGWGSSPWQWRRC